MLLAVVALVAFVLAGILRLVGQHAEAVQWLIIIGGVFISAWGVWGWAGPRYAGRQVVTAPRTVA